MLKCKCGSKQFGYFDDYGVEYDYCLVCNRAYDNEGNEIQIQKGEPDNDYNPNSPEQERDIKEDL